MELENLREKYIELFDDMFPNISISEGTEREILERCIKEKKDAYELGYFSLENDY